MIGQIDRYVALSLIYSHLIGVKPKYLTTCKNYNTKGNNFTIVPHILQENNVLTIQQDTLSINSGGWGGWGVVEVFRQQKNGQFRV